MKQLKLILALCLLTLSVQGQNIHTVATYNNTHWLFDSTVVPKYNTSLLFYGIYVDINTDIANFRKIKVTELLNGDGLDTAFGTGDAIRNYFEALLSDTAGLTPVTYVAGDNITINDDTISATASGGGEDLDSTLALGNTTDLNIITTGRVDATTHRATNPTSYGDYTSVATSPRTYTGPDLSGTLALTSQLTVGGSIQFSGDGATSSFNIPHGISGTPTKISITPGSQAASAAHWVLSVGATNIVIRFAGPPAGGVNNITFYWTATP